VKPDRPIDDTKLETMTEATKVVAPTKLAVTKVVETPMDALHLEEIGRTRLIAMFGAMLAATVITITLLTPGHQLARTLHLAGMGTLGATYLAVLWLIRDDREYRTWHTLVLGHVGAGAMATSYYYWGVFAPDILAVPLFVYLFALGQSFRGSLSILLLSVVPHTVLSLAYATNALDDPGLLRLARMPVVLEVATTIYIEIMFVGAFMLARKVRRSSLDAIEKLREAARSVAQREALLIEAKHDLAVARRVGGPGLYTGRVVGSFELGHLLGRGAMGDVYEATPTEGGDLAAVKMLTYKMMDSKTAVERFFREIEIAGALESPHIVRVVEVSADAAATPYLAMERLTGETLADILRRTTRMRSTELAEALRAVSSGISVAHAAGAIHRDLKPSNVFAHRPLGTKRPIWKILDFGISKLAGDDGTLTEGNVIGTPSYMSPEQARGEPCDERADIYAMGAIAYRALTGHPPFTGADVPSTLYAVDRQMPARPSASPGVRAPFDSVLAVAMAKDRTDRFQTPAELSEAFDAAATDTLDPAVVARALAVLSHHPWRAQR
jgi:serine/threonine-protein kinase